MSSLGNKEIMANNIRFYLSQNGISQTEICQTLGFSMSTFSDWVHARTYPRIDKIELMANYFGIEKSDLVEERTKSQRAGVAINVLGRVAAGIPINAITEIIDTEEISEDLAKTGDFFALKIKGDSMKPRIVDGDVVIVKQQEDAENGDTVIALVNGDDAVCKRLRKYRDGLELISNNPAYAPMFFDKETIETKPVRIIGKVVELRGKF
ncbi:XRE family transcriptional regulator [Coprococcus sp. RTP31081st1_D2_RTP31081_211007]|uniref:LexA family protein n=1 Tax=unclassified Coprococcus TaxID=2684943 RepID=UPI0032F09070